MELKILIRTKKQLWHDIMRRRFHDDERQDKLLYYKALRRTVRNRRKSDIRKYESNIVINSREHPRLLYKYIKDKMNVKDNIRAMNNLDGSVVTNPKKFVKYLMSGSIQFSKVRMFQICP